MSSQSGTSQSVPPKIEKSFDIFNPGGDPAVLRKCAGAWREMANGLKTISDGLDTHVQGLKTKGTWTGAAADGFRAHWGDTKEQIDAALPNFQNVATQLDKAADAIEKANKQIQDIVIQIEATAIVGIGLSILTAGFSDAVAAAGAAAEASEAGAVVTRVAKILEEIEKVLEAVKDAMENSKLLKFGVTFAKNLGANFTGDILGQELSGQQVTYGADFQDSAVSAGISTSLSAAGQAMAPQLQNKLDAVLTGPGSHRAGPWSGSNAIANALAGEGLSGHLAMGGLTSAAGQAGADTVDMIEGTKNSTNLWQDTLTSGLSGAAGGAAVHTGEAAYEPGEGTHRAPGAPTWTGGHEVATNGSTYAVANAGENHETGGTDAEGIFNQTGSPLTNPQGAFPAE